MTTWQIFINIVLTAAFSVPLGYCFYHWILCVIDKRERKSQFSIGSAVHWDRIMKNNPTEEQKQEFNRRGEYEKFADKLTRRAGIIFWFIGAAFFGFLIYLLWTL
jgi:hypothetical protein